MDLFFAFFRVTAKYMMKKRALAASPCGDPINDLFIILDISEIN